MDRERWTRLLRWSFAAYWYSQALIVWHPFARKTLALRGIPATTAAVALYCSVAVAMGILHLRRHLPASLLALQAVVLLIPMAALIPGQPMLLVHPLGVFTKTLPLLVLLWWMASSEDAPTRRQMWILRIGMAVIWWTEGLFPKILFQQRLELDMVHACGLSFVEPSLFLWLLGSAQVASGFAVLLLRGKLLRWLLAIQLFALCALPVMVVVIYPEQLFLPSGPLLKSFPLIAGTYLVFRMVEDEREVAR